MKMLVKDHIDYSLSYNHFSIYAYHQKFKSSDRLKVAYSISYNIAIFIFLLFFILVPVQSFSQNQPLTLSPDKEITQYDHTIWQSKDGLLQNSVTSIIQSSDGYLWIGTYDGICRFDGTDFTNFKNENAHILKNSYIYSLYEGSDKTIWIGTARAGLVSYKNGTFINHYTNGELPFRNIRTIVQDSTGTLWLGTKQGIVTFKNGKYHVFKSLESQNVNEINCIIITKDHAIWFGTNNNGIIIYKKGKFSRLTKKEGLNSNTIHTLTEDKNGKIWIGTAGGGLNVYHNGRIRYITKKNGLTSNIIDSFIIDREGTIWIGTEGGGVDRIVHGNISHYTTFQGLSNDVIGSLFEDQEGDLWIGTLGGGLNKLRDGKFTSYTTREGLTNNFVWTICSDVKHRIWIGTNGGGINILHNKVVHVVDTSNGLSSNYVRSIYKAQNGLMWVGTYKGVDVISNGHIIRKLTVKSGLSSNKILAINEDSSQNVWIGTSKGLDRYEKGKISTYTTKNGLPDNYIRTIYKDRQNRLWIGTKNGGLSLFKNGSFKDFTVKDGLPSNDIISIYEDHTGTIWIGTFWGGISRFRNGKFVNITSDQGLPDNVIYSIFEDNNHNLWFSCNKGIFRISIQELNDYANGKIDIVSPTLYGNAEGLKNTECNGGNYPAGWQTSNDKIWFPTVGGVAMIDPNHLRRNTVPPNVHIEAVLVDYRKNILHQKDAISAGNHRFVFRYTAISLTSSEHVAFKYKLKGFDTNWISADNRRSAYYTNLPPGTYTFKVIASNNDRVWNTKGSSFTFTIPTPFYKTYWAYSLYSISLFMVFFGFIRWQSEVTRRKELEKFEKEQLKLKAEQEHLKLLATESEARERENQLLLKAQQKEISFEKERREHELSVATAFAQGVEDERARIARELHDHILGSLNIVMRRIQKVLRKFKKRSNGNNNRKILVTDVQNILPDLDKIGQDIRQIMDDLKPGSLDFFGLVEALDGLLNKQIDSVDKPVKLKVTAPSKITTMDAFTKITVFRIFQEAISNAINHADPTHIELYIEEEHDQVIFKLIDDGKGFDFEKTINSIKHRKDKGGHGLMNMLHRATTINAQIYWSQADPHGTIMNLIIPLGD